MEFWIDVMIGPAIRKESKDYVPSYKSARYKSEVTTRERSLNEPGIPFYVSLPEGKV